MKKNRLSWSVYTCLFLLCFTILLPLSVHAAELPSACYPTAVSRSEDGSEVKKYYDLSPQDDPAGIPRSDFQQDGFQYTLTDLLRQELPEQEQRSHTETVSLSSPKKDMESVLALLPQEKDFLTDDGFSGTLTLRLDTVQVEPSGYGSSTKTVSASRSYPNLESQDLQYLPKSIEENGRILTLSNVQWQEVGSRFTATATYTGSATSSYIKGYTVTADYTGTVSRIALNKVRYVAVFEGTPLPSIVSLTDTPSSVPTAPAFRWRYLLIPLGFVTLVGGGIGVALICRHRAEQSTEDEEDESA